MTATRPNPVNGDIIVSQFAEAFVRDVIHAAMKRTREFVLAEGPASSEMYNASNRILDVYGTLSERAIQLPNITVIADAVNALWDTSPEIRRKWREQDKLIDKETPIEERT